MQKKEKQSMHQSERPLLFSMIESANGKTRIWLETTLLQRSARSGKSTLRLLANCWLGWPTMKDLPSTGTWKQTPHLSTDGAPPDGLRPRLLPLKLLRNWSRSETI